MIILCGYEGQWKMRETLIHNVIYHHYHLDSIDKDDARVGRGNILQSSKGKTKFEAFARTIVHCDILLIKLNVGFMFSDFIIGILDHYLIYEII